MKQTGKIIKYMAIALASIIIFSIVSGTILIITKVINIYDDKEIIENLPETEITENIKNLNIDILTTKLIIKKGEKFTFETNNEYIKSDKGSNKLYIKEETHNILFKNTNYELIIYIPDDMIFEEISIETSAGSVNIDKLTTNILELDLGAGNVSINELNVLDKTTIDGGAGEITILQGNMKNLDLDTGVGKLTLNTCLLGTNKIDAGVGQVNINLLGDNYRIYIEKGIGTTLVNNEKVKENITLGNGETILEIDGGVGSINITTKNPQKTESTENKFEMKVDKYLKNDENEIVILGTVVNGTINYGEEIELIDENNNVITTTKVSNKNPEIYQTKIEEAKPNDKVSIIVDETIENELKQTKTIIGVR